MPHDHVEQRAMPFFDDDEGKKDVMHSNEMSEQNSRAILMLDSREIEPAERIFCENYRKFPCLMTAVNYAVFLLDEHFIADETPRAKLLMRKMKARRLLARYAKQVDNYKAAYHVECMLGRVAFERLNIKKARTHYQKALDVRADSVEAITMLAWTAFLQGDCAGSLTYLDKLSSVLQLGDDMEYNIDALDDNCPFLSFPYYTLRVVVLDGIGLNEQAIKLLDELCENYVNVDEPRFLVTTLTALCLKLHNYRWLEPLLDKTKSTELLYSDYQINMALYLIFKASMRNHELRKLVKRLWHETSMLSKFECGIELLLRLFRRKISTITQINRVHYKDCQFIDCPKHDDW